jgi:phage anti-repressor protein
MRKKLVNCKKCKMRSISLITVGRKKMIDSFELYGTSGMLRNNYTRWMLDTVLPLGCVHKDYTPAPGNRRKKVKKIRYYFKIDFAIALCLVMRRKRSMEIRNFLMASKNGK